MEREYVVFWETLTRFSCRHYSRNFDTETAAVAFARKKHDTNPLITALIVREQEKSEYTAPDGCPGVRVNILRFVKWWQD